MADTAPAPAHARVVDALSEGVASGKWREGEMLPGRRALAREFGVSVNTVNKAIEQMVQRGELRADDRRGTFVANGACAAEDIGSLREGGDSRGATVGVVASFSQDRSTSNWTISVIESLERHVSELNGRTQFYNVVYPGERSFETADEAFDAALSGDNDALVVVSVNAEPEWGPSVLEVSRRSPIPLLCIWYTGMHRAVPHVHVDQYAAGRIAAEHILDSGYEGGLFLAPFEADWLTERIAGAKDAFGAVKAEFHVIPRSIKADTRHVRPEVRRKMIAETISEGMRRVKFGKHPKGFWGVIGASDNEAILARSVFEELGFHPGADVGIVGFDDSDESRRCGLSTLHPPLEELGELAAHFTTNAVRGRAAPTRTGVKPHLHARNSTDRGKDRGRS